MTVVAVTGLHRGENPQPGAAVASALRRRFPDLRIVGLSYDPLESSLYAHDGSRPNAAYLLPYPGIGIDAVRERLFEILEQEKLDIIIPCLDSEIAIFIALQAELAEKGVRCLLPTQKALDARSKVNLPVFCRRLGIDTPRTESANDAGTLAAYAEAIGYPVFVKGRFYDAHRVTTPQELVAAFDEIFGVWGGPVLVQEAVVGEEYNIAGLGDGAGGLIGICSIRKMLRTTAGKGFAGIVVANPVLDTLVLKIIKALRWTGPFELEFIKIPHRPHALFEMNPRFPAWIDFPAQIGCNLPARLVERLLNLPLTPFGSCPAGRMFIRHSTDVVTDIADIARMATAGRRADPLSDARPELEVIR